MKGGTRFSLTCLISREELTVQTTSKPLGTLLFSRVDSFEFLHDHIFVTIINFHVCRVQIHANCRIRRIYFSDRLYTEDELPPEFKLFLPVAGKPQGGPQWVRSASAHQSRLGWNDKKGHFIALSIDWESKTHNSERAFVIEVVQLVSVLGVDRPTDVVCRPQRLTQTGWICKTCPGTGHPRNNNFA